MLSRLSPFATGLRLVGRVIEPGGCRPVLRFVAALDMTQFQKAIVKSLPEEPNLTITLSLAGKLRNLDRPKDEPLEKPLLRIQKSAVPQLDKRQRRQAANAAKQRAQMSTDAEVDARDPAVVLHVGPTEDTPALDAAAISNAEAWQQGRLLRVGQDCFTVELNPPLIDRVELPAVHAFVGVPLYPLLAVHFADEDACEWRWMRRSSPREAWAEIPGATVRRYTPGPDDVGCELRVECRPARRLPSSPSLASAAPSNGSAPQQGAEPPNVVYGELAFTVTGPVRVPPSPLGAQPRLALTEERTQPPEFRVVSYNILADQYAGTDTAKRVLFKHCPPECLLPEYRRPLVLSELLGFRGDIICLQEVDDKMFTQLLLPQLRAEGYEGVYANKAGKVREGGAVFWRADRFTRVVQRDLTLKDFFPAAPGEPSPYDHVFGPMLSSSPQLLYALQRVATVAQLVLLAPVNDPQGVCRPLVVANTHLFFHYMAPHIRTVHTWVVMQEAKKLMDQACSDPALQQQLRAQEPTLLFCGDLNSDLNDGIPGAVELLSRGRLPADYWDWMFGVEFRWGMSAEEGGSSSSEEGGEGEEGNGTGSGEYGEVTKMVHGSVEHKHPSPAPSSAGSVDGQQEVVAGVDLEVPFLLAPADRLRTPFTNYVKGYQGLLDYVWYSPGDVEVSREVPPPISPRGLGGSYLPSPAFPSDHLPVVFDLRFTDPQHWHQHQGQQQQHQQQQAVIVSPEGGAVEAAADSSNILKAAFYNVGAAVEALAAGEMIAVPTDTLYGVAACANSPEGVRAIYDAKQRCLTKPLAICVAEPSDVARYGETKHLPKGVLEELLPGPVTLLLTRKPGAPLADELNPGVEGIGIRIPDAPFIRAICRQHRGALALTSANLSQGLSPTHIAEFPELWPLCAAVFDGGALEKGRAGSTIIDLTVPGRFRIERRGAGFSNVVKLLTGKYGMVHDLD